MILKKCPNCEMENPDSAKFCTECGTELEAEEKEPSVAFEPSETPPRVAAEKPAQPEFESEPLQTLTEAPPGYFPLDKPADQPFFGERFKIIEELGTGRLGKVFLVFDKAMEREMAARLIRADIAQDSQAFADFSRELNTERGIVHKNVARIFELHSETGTPFITMEFVPGQDLKRLIRQREQIPKEIAVSIAMQVCEGLAEIHRLGLIHGDLRTDNIRIDKDGTAKIMDIGITPLLKNKMAAGTGATISSPEYLSPEQVKGTVPDRRSDIYSLGIILYEMLTGSLPFSGETPETIGRKHLEEIPRPPQELNPRIPVHLSLLVLRCLEKDRQKRYQTAKELQVQLDKIETLSRPETQPAPAVPPLKQFPAKTEVRAISKLAAARKKFAPLEKLDLKKLALPVAAAAVVLILGFVLWHLIIAPSKEPKPDASASLKPSVAVLPFEDLSPGKTQEYLGDGMAESLIDALSHISDLYIPAKTSSFSFKAGGTDNTKIGRKLAVEHVFQAGFQETENKLQLSARLIQAESGAVVWSQEYERNPEDIFTVEEEIAQSIVRALKIRLPQEKKAVLFKNRAANYEGFVEYAQGRFFMGKGGKENLEKAMAHLQKAIEKDPQYSPAYTALADVYINLASTSFRPRDKAFLAAKDAALKALLLDPGAADAHMLLALIKQDYEWDFAAAEKEYREALRIKQNNAAARYLYSVLLSALGLHEQALSEIKTARSLDPLSPAINAQVGAALYFARIYDQAVEELKRALLIAPGFYENYDYLGLAYIQMGQYEDAIRSFERAADLGREAVDTDLRIAFVHALQGRRREVGGKLTEALKAAKQTYVSYVSIASVYAGLNEKEQALFCLEKAFEERDINLIFLKVLPLVDSARGDSRFVNLITKIGLIR